MLPPVFISTNQYAACSERGITVVMGDHHWGLQGDFVLAGLIQFWLGFGGVTGGIEFYTYVKVYIDC